MIPGVPYDAEIEYLESTGTQYIDTGVVATNDTHINVKFSDYSVAGAWLFGARIAFQNGALGVYTNASVGQNNWSRARGNKYWANDFNYITANVGVVTFDYDKSIFTATRELDSTTVTFTDVVNNFSSSPYTMHLWTINNGGSLANVAHAKIYSVKIWDNETLVRDFIPVRVGQTGYMYDRVTRRLFGNKGTGSFVLGPDMAKPVMGLWGMRKVYTADDYIKGGLVAMWDGIENAGRGQWGKNNPNATDWPALVGGNTWGTGTNIKYNSEKHYYDTNRVGNSDALKFNLPKAVNLRGSTFEFVVEGNYASADYRFLIGLNSEASDGDFFQIGVSQVRMHYRGSSLYATGALNTPYTFSARSSASGPARLYRNSVMVQSPNASDFNVTNLRCPADSANHVSGKLWAIRVYSRDLSPAEIAHNYQIDKARFNLP